MARATDLLNIEDWYDHDGPHQAISVARGAAIGYWYGQPDWHQRPRDHNNGIPARDAYRIDQIEDCCSTYGFRKGHRYRLNDYSDKQSDEETRRNEAPSRMHRHTPLTVARGTAIGFAAGRTGTPTTEDAPTDLIRSCCAGFGYGHGIQIGGLIFFEQATEAEKAEYHRRNRTRRNDHGWG
ncbi:hypothetical protein GTY67_13585 [Streptomyces sp. SID8374]|uniref:hypothetical protein n=1 Tax=Streptomyces sp. SID8374 TaxID=2690354 RepID=UPI0013706698|nr:hypothetical protein [Streptomyces sp. SID8374]MYX14429.1 hypothetical protein [Streptomyces sp. SID8374]